MSLGINRMNIKNHLIICGMVGKNPSQPINSPFTVLSNTKATYLVPTHHSIYLHAYLTYYLPRVQHTFFVIVNMPCGRTLKPESLSIIPNNPNFTLNFISIVASRMNIGDWATLNRLISVRWRLVLEPIVTQNTKCHLKVQLVLEIPLCLFCIVKVEFH
jgi:hypothetical protein